MTLVKTEIPWTSLTRSSKTTSSPSSNCFFSAWISLALPDSRNIPSVSNAKQQCYVLIV